MSISDMQAKPPSRRSKAKLHVSDFTRSDFTVYWLFSILCMGLLETHGPYHRSTRITHKLLLLGCVLVNGYCARQDS